MTDKNFKYEPAKTVVEIGCNHMGDFSIACELIDLAKHSGAKIVKFQKRFNKELLTEMQYNTPHPVIENSYGNTYGEHREYLEFTLDEHRKLKNYCEKNNLIYSTSVWDLTSAKEISSLNPDFIKIPSACNNNYKILEYLRDNFSGQVHVSLGMTSQEEVEQIINLFEVGNFAKDRLVIYACTSGYPVEANESCLLEIRRLYDLYHDKVYEIGFSGHHLGIALDIVAYTLGAKWIERHFTKNRAWKGTDHSASLEPQGLNKLIRDLDAAYLSLQYKEKEILDVEIIQRNKLKYRL